VTFSYAVELRDTGKCNYSSLTNCYLIIVQ
jgi:hypothetical protein